MASKVWWRLALRVHMPPLAEPRTTLHLSYIFFVLGLASWLDNLTNLFLGCFCSGSPGASYQDEVPVGPAKKGRGCSPHGEAVDHKGGSH